MRRKFGPTTAVLTSFVVMATGGAVALLARQPLLLYLSFVSCVAVLGISLVFVLKQQISSESISPFAKAAHVLFASGLVLVFFTAILPIAGLSIHTRVPTTLGLALFVGGIFAEFLCVGIVYIPKSMGERRFGRAAIQICFLVAAFGAFALFLKRLAFP